MVFGIETRDGIIYSLDLSGETPVPDEKAQIAAAFLSVFGSEGEGEKDGNEWEWIVAPIPGLYLILYIERDSGGKWIVEEVNTGSKDFCGDLVLALKSVHSQLRDVWFASPKPSLHLFFGDLT